jgi:HD superfamily phosphohydrolase
MERLYRDAVHNIIRIETRSAAGAMFAALVDAPEFQRLRRVRQLGLAYVAYQSAEHSRFTHSLGAFHLAARILDRLAGSCAISEDEKTAVLAAALLHDIGHGAFSHVIESILGFHHEAYSIETILSEATGVNRVLAAFSSELPRRVASIIQGSFERKALGQLVSSQLDVDRMDYLLRDSLMTGAKYGIFDLEWIIKSIRIDEAADRLYVSAAGIAAVEDYLQARYYMFRQVYFHRTLRSAESVLRSILKRAIELYRTGGDVWHVTASPFEKVLKGERLTLAEHLALDDADVIFHVKQWRQSADRILSDLSARFIDRRLFKALDLDMPQEERLAFLQNARRIVTERGFDAEYYVVEDSARHADYYFYSREGASDKDLIFVEDGFSRPRIREISEVSAAVRGLQEGFRADRVCFPAEVADEIAAAYRPELRDAAA